MFHHPPTQTANWISLLCMCVYTIIEFLRISDDCFYQMKCLWSEPSKPLQSWSSCEVSLMKMAQMCSRRNRTYMYFHWLIFTDIIPYRDLSVQYLLKFCQILRRRNHRAPLLYAACSLCLVICLCDSVYLYLNQSTGWGGPLKTNHLDKDQQAECRTVHPQNICYWTTRQGRHPVWWQRVIKGLDIRQLCRWRQAALFFFTGLRVIAQ